MKLRGMGENCPDYTCTCTYMSIYIVSFIPVFIFFRRIWRKVNSRKGLPHMPNEKNGTTESDDDDDDESKWNWYIS